MGLSELRSRSVKWNFSVSILKLAVATGLVPVATWANSLAESGNLGLNGSLVFSVSGESFQNEQTRARLVGTQIELLNQYWLQQRLFMDANFKFSFTTGYVQSLESDKSNASEISLSSAGVHFRPYTLSQLSLGALAPNEVHSTLLLDEQPFPAFRADLNLIKMGKSSINTFAQSAIVTTQSLNPDASSSEPAPELKSIGAKLKLAATDRQYLNLKMSYFEFSNISNSMATASAGKGNTTTPISEAERSFVNQFKGVDVSLGGAVPLTNRLSLTGTAAYIKNQSASDKLNLAHLMGVGGIYRGSRQDWKLTSSYFRIEPDATVSAYAPSQFFNTNRVGYSTEGEVRFNKERFSIKLAYTDAQILYQAVDQSREQFFMLKLETTYAYL